MTTDSQDQKLDLSFTRTTKDVAVAGLAGAIIATLLLVFFYFTFKEDVTSTTKRLDTIESRIGSIEQQMVTLQQLPEEVRRTMIRETLGEITRGAAILQSQLQDQALKDKMSSVQQLIGEVQQSYE